MTPGSPAVTKGGVTVRLKKAWSKCEKPNPASLPQSSHSGLNVSVELSEVKLLWSCQMSSFTKIHLWEHLLHRSHHPRLSGRRGRVLKSLWLFCWCFIALWTARIWPNGVSVSRNLPTPAVFCSVPVVTSPKPASAAELYLFIYLFIWGQSCHWPVGDQIALLDAKMQMKGFAINSN